MGEPMIVQNFSFSGGVCRKSALDWSPENKVAICTNKGVFIMSSYCSPIETGFPLPLHKQVIPLSSDVIDFKLFADISLKYEGVHCPDCIYDIYLDRTLLPRKDTVHPQGYKCAKWSPRGANSDGSCLLATLAMDHRLVLHREKDKEWELVRDLTEMLYEIHQAGWSDDEEEDDSEEEEERRKKIQADKDSGQKFSNRVVCEEVIRPTIYKLKSRAYNLAPVEMLWTNMFSMPPTSANEGGTSWCYLVVAMKSGRIVWWKVSPDDVKMVSLACEWDPKIGLITSLSWQQTTSNSGFLVMGSYFGQLGISSVSVKMDGAEPKLFIKPVSKIWLESDRIRIDHTAVMKINVKRYIVVAAKQNFIVSCEVSITESDIIIKHKNHCLGLHRMPVTGMNVISGMLPETHLLMSSMEGLLVKTKVTATQKGIELQHEAFKLPDVDLEHNTIQGLGVSNNGALCALIMDTTMLYDHHIKTDSLQFVVFVTKPLDEIFIELDHVLKPQLSFLPTATTSICKYMDYMECSRISLASCSVIPDLFQNLIGWTMESYERLSAIELHFIRFLLKCFISGLAIHVPREKTELEEKLNAIETVIMQNYVSKVVSGCHDKVDLLSPAQSQSLLLMADWLFMQYKVPIANLYEAFGYECPSDVESIPARESCRICQLPVKLENIRYGECEQKHKFGRCCLSLILCDMTPYYQCMSCKSMALEDVWCNKFICTYCSLPMSR